MEREDRRVGRFRIELKMIDEEPELARRILNGCLVIRAEAHDYGRRIEYIAEHDQFDVLQFGEMVPDYRRDVIRINGVDGVGAWHRQ